MSWVHCGRVCGGLKALRKTTGRRGISGTAKVNESREGWALAIDWLIGRADTTLTVLGFLDLNLTAEDVFERADDAFEWRYDSIEFWSAMNCYGMWARGVEKGWFPAYHSVDKICKPNLNLFVLQHVFSSQFTLYKFLEKLCKWKFSVKEVEWQKSLLCFMSVEANKLPIAYWRLGKFRIFMLYPQRTRSKVLHLDFAQQMSFECFVKGHQVPLAFPSLG